MAEGKITDKEEKPIEERFSGKGNSEKEPPQYTKRGKLILGEWINGKFVRYKKDTPRPDCFTPEDWQGLPAKV